jgi:hypothetical protein
VNISELANIILDNKAIKYSLLQQIRLNNIQNVHSDVRHKIYAEFSKVHALCYGIEKLISVKVEEYNNE